MDMARSIYIVTYCRFLHHAVCVNLNSSSRAVASLGFCFLLSKYFHFPTLIQGSDQKAICYCLPRKQLTYFKAPCHISDNTSNFIYGLFPAIYLVGHKNKNPFLA